MVLPFLSKYLKEDLDFSYNFGQANWKQSSMLRNLKAGQYKQACDSLLKWKYVAKGTCKDMKGLSMDDAKKMMKS